MFAQTLDGQPISAGIGSSQQQAYQSLAESLNLGSTGPRVYEEPVSAGIGSSQQQAYQSLAESLNLGSTGPRVYEEPISAGIGSSQQQAYQSLAESLNLGSTGPGVYTDGQPLDPDVERSLEPYDPFADAPYDPGQEAYDPISDSPYDDIDIATPGLGSAQQRAEQEFAEDQDLGSTGPDYTDEPTTERHRYIALLQYADSLDQELLQRQLLNTAEAGASAGATIRERVPPERVAAMSTSQLQRINDQIEDQLIEQRTCTGIHSACSNSGWTMEASRGVVSSQAFESLFKKLANEWVYWHGCRWIDVANSLSYFV
eukprot:COSAG05_NODE_1049_length_6033_cov_7.763566_2_plen_315_part_00